MRAGLVLLLLALASHIALATAYLRANPAFEGPDENDHLYYAYYLEQSGRLPLIKDSSQRLGRGSYEEASLGHHPPLYYWLLGLTMRAIGHGDWAPAWRVNPGWVENHPDWQQDPQWRDHHVGATLHWQHGYDEHRPRSPEIGVLRWLRAWSVLFGALSVVATFILGRLLFPDDALVAGLAALLLASVPQWSFVHGSADNGNLATVLSHWALVVMALAVRRRRLGVGAGAALGVLTGLALLTKYTSVFLGPMLLVLYGLALWRWPGQRRAAFVSGLVALALILAICGWCGLRNWRLYGDPLAVGAHAIAYASNHVPPDVLWDYLLGDFPRRTFVSAIGEFGSSIVPVPGAIVALATALLLLASFGWLRRGRALTRSSGAALAIPLLAIAIVTASLIKYNTTFIQPQGRYLFPAFGSLFVLIAAGLHTLAGRWVLVAVLAPVVAFGVFEYRFRPYFAAELTMRQEDAAQRPDPHYASMIDGMRTPPPRERQRLTLTAPADGAELREPPTFSWDAPDHRPEHRYTLHLWLASGQVVAGTYEWFGIELAEPRWAIPESAWRNLPAGVQVYCKVRRLPDRQRGESVADVPESAPIRVTRIE